MQYKVPQNIDLEDKIVGPFTMKQFLYLLICGGVIYGWWNYVNSLNEIYYINLMPTFLALAIPVGLFGFCMAVVKVNDRPFEIFLLGVFKFLASPKQRMWIDNYKPKETIILDANQPVEEKNQAKDTRSLDDLAKALEKQSASIREQQAPAPTKSPTKIAGINLSVNDVATVSKKQVAAQK